MIQAPGHYQCYLRAGLWQPLSANRRDYFLDWNSFFQYWNTIILTLFWSCTQTKNGSLSFIPFVFKGLIFMYRQRAMHIPTGSFSYFTFFFFVFSFVLSALHSSYTESLVFLSQWGVEPVLQTAKTWHGSWSENRFRDAGLANAGDVNLFYFSAISFQRAALAGENCR